MPYAELCHYEFTSGGREEVNEEKLRRWKREQALFMQRSPELFLNGDPWLGGSVEKVGVASDPKRVGPASRNLEHS
jgi:hypothetical protein